MRRLFSAVAILALAAGTAGCRTARANAPATRPALEVPPPPPRMIEPLPSEPVAPLEPVADLPPAPTTSKPRPTRETASRETQKTEPKPEPVPPTTTEPAPPPANPPAANSQPQIRTPGDNPEAVRQIREVLDRATKSLEKVDYRALSQQRKESYDTAKKFMLGAEEAIKQSNFVYARFLADKADTLAKELQGR